VSTLVEVLSAATEVNALTTSANVRMDSRENTAKTKSSLMMVKSWRTAKKTFQSFAQLETRVKMEYLVVTALHACSLHKGSTDANAQKDGRVSTVTHLSLNQRSCLWNRISYRNSFILNLRLISLIIFYYVVKFKHPCTFVEPALSVDYNVRLMFNY